MATRFYLVINTPADVTPPAVLAGWGHSVDSVRKLVTTPDSSTLANIGYSPDASDHIIDTNACHRRCVSDPLAAQTLSGNITAQIQCLELRASNNMFLALAVRVISNDGTTVRNESLGVTRATSLEISTTLTNRTFPSTSIGSFACASGDRILIELGVGGLPTAVGGSPDGHNAQIRAGMNASSGDLPVNETETGTTFRGWIEFSNTFTFQGAEEFDAALMAAMNRPWPDIIFQKSKVVASGMKPSNAVNN